jgi:hypothetical protein
LKKQVRTRDSCHSFSLQHTQSIAFSENSAFKYLRLLALSNMVILQCKQSTQYKNSFGGAIFLYQQEHIISSIFPRRILPKKDPGNLCHHQRISRFISLRTWKNTHIRGAPDETKAPFNRINFRAKHRFHGSDPSIERMEELCAAIPLPHP